MRLTVETTSAIPTMAGFEKFVLMHHVPGGRAAICCIIVREKSLAPPHDLVCGRPIGVALVLAILDPPCPNNLIRLADGSLPPQPFRAEHHLLGEEVGALSHVSLMGREEFPRLGVVGIVGDDADAVGNGEAGGHRMQEIDSEALVGRLEGPDVGVGGEAVTAR